MKKIKKEAIAHYNRMIEWVKTTKTSRQELRQYVVMDDMSVGIGEDWYSEHCSYCKAHDFYCTDCPLNSSHLPQRNMLLISKHCCKGLWGKMSQAKTWQAWLKYAEQVLDYIKTNG